MSETVYTNPAQKKSSTLANTLKCIAVLAAIAVVCVAILAVANRFLQVDVTLDAATSALINKIAPTGESDDAAFSNGSIKMVDLSKGTYKITSLDDYNKQYGSANNKIRALYTSKHKDTGKITLVVEAENKGKDGAVVMLVAYDADNTITGATVKAQSESYWDRINEANFCAALVGVKGHVNASTSSIVAASSGATLTRNAMVGAVNLASDFIVRLGKEEKPEKVQDQAEKTQLSRVSDAASFTRYPVQEGKTAYVGDNGDLVIKANGGESTTYGKVTVLVLVKNGAVVKAACIADSFDPTGKYDSDKLRNDETLTMIFAGQTAQTLAGQSGKLPGITGATESSNGVREAVLHALQYAATFDAGAWEA